MFLEYKIIKLMGHLTSHRSRKTVYPRYASTTIAPFGGSGRGISEVLDVVAVVVFVVVVMVTVSLFGCLFEDLRSFCCCSWPEAEDISCLKNPSTFNF